jgi:hypothetical protein
LSGIPSASPSSSDSPAQAPAPSLSVYWVELLLFAVSTAVGLARMWGPEGLELRPVMMMLSLPAVAAILAGAFAAPFLRETAVLRPWPLAVTVPAMHGLMLSALAHLVAARFTNLEQPENLHPSLLWLDLRLVASSAVVQLGILAVTLALLGRAKVPVEPGRATE